MSEHAEQHLTQGKLQQAMISTLQHIALLNGLALLIYRPAGH